MRKFKVRLTRLVEEECFIFVDGANAEDAQDKAFEDDEKVAEGIWRRTDAEPESFTAEVETDAEFISKETEVS